MVDTSSAPYNAIVRLTVRKADGMYQASGVMISPDEVLTAAHVVWTTGQGIATNITAYPGYDNGATPYGAYSGRVTHYNAINDTGGYLGLSDVAADYAVIHLDRPTTAGTMTVGVAPSSTMAAMPRGVPSVNRPTSTPEHAAMENWMVPMSAEALPACAA